mmetsp:Transcript_43464/g.50011  ORF Transcript_43464/g.50011 Transcript_43464/m.50011 type:complete len:82 (+) Transcript_43464:118-363(+)
MRVNYTKKSSSRKVAQKLERERERIISSSLLPLWKRRHLPLRYHLARILGLLFSFSSSWSESELVFVASLEVVEAALRYDA